MNKRLSIRVFGTLVALSVFWLFLGAPAEVLASAPSDPSAPASNDSLSAAKEVPDALGSIEVAVRLAHAASAGDLVALPPLPVMKALCLPQVCPRSPPQHS